MCPHEEFMKTVIVGIAQKVSAWRAHEDNNQRNLTKSVRMKSS